MKPSKTAWLVTPQAPDSIFGGLGSISGNDTIIAVDGGLKRCIELGLKADYLCGDLDSIATELYATMQPHRIWRFPERKNETDTELAIIKAMEKGAQKIIVLNAMQGRVDHILGLIQNLCFGFQNGIDIAIETSCQRVFFLPKVWKAQGFEGCLLSLIAFGGDAIFTSSSGLSWPLDGLTLKPELSRGISNEIISNQLSIKVADGRALAILTKSG